MYYLAVEEALNQILGVIEALPAEEVALSNLAGRILAENLISPINLPPFHNSAMDGYAVQAADLTDCSAENPRTLQLVGEVAAGQTWAGTLQAGQALRIMTGAAVPDGADSVVRFEDTDENLTGQKPLTNQIVIRRQVSCGTNVRRAGEDLAAGAPALLTGTKLGPVAVGLIASLGYAQVKCYRRPRVAIIATGGELVAPGQPLVPGKIYNSNNFILMALLQQTGANLVSVGQTADEQQAIQAQLQAALEAGVDLIITTGGVSVGDFDLVKQVLQTAGQMHLWQVKMRPGKPLAFGQLGGVPLLGLPGNPMAALVCFEVFGRAILRKLQGLAPQPQLLEAQLTVPVDNRSKRRYFLRGRLTAQDSQLFVTVLATQGAAHLSSAALSNCLIVAHEEREFYAAGDKIQVMPLSGTALV